MHDCQPPERKRGLKFWTCPVCKQQWLFLRRDGWKRV